MSGPVSFSGPVPPAGSRYCTVCAASWKAQVIEGLEPQPGSTHDLRTLPAAREASFPALAVAEGLVVLPVPPSPGVQSGAPAIVPVPLCWTHLQAVRFLEGSVLAAAPGQMPGGAADLGRRRH